MIFKTTPSVKYHRSFWVWAQPVTESGDVSHWLCPYQEFYLWMNIVPTPGIQRQAADTLAPCLSIFSHLAMLWLEHCKLELYVDLFYVYFTWHSTYSATICQNQCDWYIQSHISVQRYVYFAVIRSYVAKFAARLYKANDGSGTFAKTFLLTRAWRQRSRPS